MLSTETFTSLQQTRAALNAACMERSAIIDGLLSCLICKQNAFLLGAPGTGKSDLVRKLTGSIKGNKHFQYLLSPTTDPSELFGPVAMTKLLKDEYTRDVEGYLPTCNTAFLDELFRGSSAVLNSLLTLLNERTYKNGKENIETPIESIVSATNSWPEEESLQAFADRFLFRPTVDFIKKPTSKRTLDSWALGLTQRPEVDALLDTTQMQELRLAASTIAIDEGFLDSWQSVLEQLSSRGLVISDRRRVQILQFLRAYAVVQGDDSLRDQHLRNTLVHILYKTKDDMQTIEEVVTQVVPSIDDELKRASDASDYVMREFNKITTHMDGKTVEDISNTVAKIKKLRQDMTQVIEVTTKQCDAAKLTADQMMTKIKTITKCDTYLEQINKRLSDICI